VQYAPLTSPSAADKWTDNLVVANQMLSLPLIGFARRYLPSDDLVDAATRTCHCSASGGGFMTSVAGLGQPLSQL